MTDDSVKIVLGGFDDVTLTLPIDWATDPHKSALWQHHVLTLRWLRGCMAGSPPHCSDTGQRILLDFFAYHSDPTTQKSRYFEDKDADHTMAERLLFFADVYACSNLLPQLKACIEHMTRAHFEVLVGGDVYRPRTNHGLMIDKAILCAGAAIRCADPDKKYAEVALRRCAEQVAWLFTSEAATREHSVAYQEYNLHVCLELREALVKAEAAPELVATLNLLLRDGQELLACATDAAGRYLPLGDSFREHNPSIIAGLRRRGTLDEGLAFGLSRGAEGAAPRHSLVVYPEAGFAFIRKGRDWSRSVQVAMTAAWHSDVHKQADDLSFVLNDGLRELVVDAGYSDRREGSPIARRTRSELAHNVVVCRERPWRASGGGQDLRTLTRLTQYHASEDVIALRGQHARIAGALVQRTLVLLDTSRLLVLDVIESELKGEFCQLFHLAPGLVTRPTDDAHCVYDADGQLCARFSSVGTPRVELVNDTTATGPVCVRWRDRSDTEPTSCLVCSTTVEAGSTLLLAQLIELGPALTHRAPTTVEGLSVTAAGVAFQFTQHGQARSVNVELVPLPPGRLRCP